MNRHSFLYGNDPTDYTKQAVRGQRVFCSDRGQRGGCGHTFALFLADILPRHTVRASLLWQLLCLLLTGGSIQAAVATLGRSLALETFYRLLRRLRRHLDRIRPCLCQRQKPPASVEADPLFHTVRHFQAVFATAACPLQEFQLVFARPLLS